MATLYLSAGRPLSVVYICNIYVNIDIYVIHTCIVYRYIKLWRS